MRAQKARSWFDIKCGCRRFRYSAALGGMIGSRRARVVLSTTRSISTLASSRRMIFVIEPLSQSGRDNFQTPAFQTNGHLSQGESLLASH